MDDTKPDDRSVRAADRERAARRGGYSAVAARISVLGALAATVPLTLQSLGESGFALFALVTQLTTILLYADLGIGNGLVTLLPAALIGSQEHQTRRLISSAVACVGVVAATGSVFLLASAPWLPWAELLNVTDPSTAARATQTVVAFGVCFCVGLPLGLAEKILLANQEAEKFYPWQILGAAAIVVLTLACVAADASVVWFVLAAVGGNVIGNLCAFVWLLWRRVHLRPRLNAIDFAMCQTLLRIGGMYFLLGMAGAAAYETGMLVISHVATAADVTTYFLAFRIASVPIMVVGLMYLPLWPAFGNALATNDDNWIRGHLRVVLRRGVGVSLVAATVFVVAGPWVARAWSGESSLDTPIGLYAAFGVWIVLCAVNGPLAMLLNAANELRFQVLCAGAMSIVNVGASILLVGRTGVSGAVIATICCQIVFVTIPSAVRIARRGWLSSQASTSPPNAVH